METLSKDVLFKLRRSDISVERYDHNEFSAVGTTPSGAGFNLKV